MQALAQLCLSVGSVHLEFHRQTLHNQLQPLHIDTMTPALLHLLNFGSHLLLVMCRQPYKPASGRVLDD